MGVDDYFGVKGYKWNQNVAQVLDRTEPVASPETVFRNLGVQIFSQRQLSEMAEGPALLRFVDQLLSRDLAVPRATTHEAETTVKKLLEKNALLRQVQQSLAVVVEEVSELTRQWNARSEVAAEAHQHKTAQEGKRHLERVGEAVAEAVKAVRDVSRSLEQRVPRLGDSSGEWSSAGTYRQLEKALLAQFGSLRTDLSAIADRFDDKATGLLKDQAVQALLLAANQAETAFLAACEQRGLTPADVERIKEVDQQLRGKNTEKDLKQRDVDRLTQEAAGLAEALGAMHNAWREETNTRSFALTRLTGIINKHGLFLTSSVVHQGSQEDFEDRIWKTMEPDGRTKLGRNWDKLGGALFRSFCTTEQRTSFWDFLTAWMGGGTLPALADWDELRAELKLHVEGEQTMARWETFRTFRVADWLDFTLHRRDGTRAGSISDDQLSDGQRNTIVLSLLLADGDAPIIVDQPEDELDSDFIFNELVPVVRGCKGSRQIVFVTHNANLPVNADADLVYALEFRGGKGQPLAQGGLDLPRVSQAVLDIMEGSRDAFERRREKYHF